MKTFNIFLYALLALFALPVTASVINTADVTISGSTFRTFQDNTTSLQWLDLDNFYTGTSYNSLDTLLGGSGFHLADLSEVQALQSSMPAISSNFDAEALIVGSSVSTRKLMWGIYEDGNSADGISYTFRYKNLGWIYGANRLRGNNTLLSSENMDYQDLGAWVVADNISVSAVPVPAAAWLFGSALLGFFGFSRRKVNA